MKQAYEEVKNELNAKLLAWKKLKNPKIKAGLILLFIGLVALKIFTTVLTFDWLKGLF